MSKRHWPTYRLCSIGFFTIVCIFMIRWRQSDLKDKVVTVKKRDVCIYVARVGSVKWSEDLTFLHKQMFVSKTDRLYETTELHPHSLQNNSEGLWCSSSTSWLKQRFKHARYRWWWVKQCGSANYWYIWALFKSSFSPSSAPALQKPVASYSNEILYEGNGKPLTDSCFFCTSLHLACRTLGTWI